MEKGCVSLQASTLLCSRVGVCARRSEVSGAEQQLLPGHRQNAQQGYESESAMVLNMQEIVRVQAHVLWKWSRMLMFRRGHSLW